MLYKCMEIEKKSNICIMRDKPGAGKTYVILSFINELKKRNKLLKKETNETNIIIVPQNIYFQWIIMIFHIYNIYYYFILFFQLSLA